MHETNTIAQWIKQRLSADPTLTELGFSSGKIWRNRAVQGTPLPYIVVSMQSGGADDNNAGARNLARPLFLIRVASSDSQNIEAHDSALKAIDALFDHASEEYEGLFIRSKGEGLFELPTDNAGGGQTIQQGRFWRLNVSPVGQ